MATQEDRPQEATSEELAVERLLKENFEQSQQAGDAAQAAVLTAIGRADAPRSPFLILFALAAVALAGFFGWRTWSHSATRENSNAGPLAAATGARDAVLILQTDPANQTALVQRFDQFSVTTAHPGAALLGGRLTGVEADALVIAIAGKDERTSVAAVNAASLEALQLEVDDLRARFAAGRAVAANMERLQSIACFGRAPEALALLHELTAPENGAPVAASAAVAECKRLDKLAEYARTATLESRRKAVRALGDTPSPYAFGLLCDLAVESDDAIALLCVDMMRRNGGSRAPAALQALADSTPSDAVRDHARATAESILHEASNAPERSR